MFSELRMTAEESDRIRNAFRKLSLVCEQGTGDADVKYYCRLQGIPDLEYIDGSRPTDLLLKVINTGEFDRYVIRCPVRKDNFIVLTKEVAEKILTLGLA